MSRFFWSFPFLESSRIRTDDDSPKIGENQSMKLILQLFQGSERKLRSIRICLLLLLVFSAFPFEKFGKAAAIEPPVIKLERENRIEPYTSRFGRKRPLVAVIAENRYTELTDFVIPYGILQRSGAADVHGLSVDPGPIHFFPALVMETGETLSSFDQKFPEGADYVVVPAMHDPENPTISRWLKSQAKKGATILGICDGVWILAHSGLLTGKNATGHWYSFSDLEKKFPDTKWIRNRRYHIDGRIITTTGVTASIPVSLALVEAISGREKALRIAQTLGAKDWNSFHRSEAFFFAGNHLLTAAKNLIFFWSHEKIPFSVSDNTDEIVLALVADAYSRTYRSESISVSEGKKPVRLKSGLVLYPDAATEDWGDSEKSFKKYNSSKAVPALDSALSDIAEMYGSSTAAFVALQLEYPRE